MESVFRSQRKLIKSCGKHVLKDSRTFLTMLFLGGFDSFYSLEQGFKVLVNVFQVLFKLVFGLLKRIHLIRTDRRALYKDITWSKELLLAI